MRGIEGGSCHEQFTDFAHSSAENLSYIYEAVLTIQSSWGFCRSIRSSCLPTLSLYSQNRFLYMWQTYLQNITIYLKSTKSSTRHPFRAWVRRRRSGRAWSCARICCAACRDQLYRNRTSRKIDSRRLFSREWDFPTLLQKQKEVIFWFPATIPAPYEPPGSGLSGNMKNKKILSRGPH